MLQLERVMARNVLLAVLLLFCLKNLQAQESPYFVTYDHHLEEPGNLEIETSVTTDIPRSGQRFYAAPYAELEYGVTTRWTAELYLESQSTWNDSTVFTGWRIENRFRVLKREHPINPIVYLEYENRSEASRIQKEVEGGAPDVTSLNSQLQPAKVHELEGKLILSSDFHDWNLSNNFIVAKNFSRNEGFEFGYSVGFSHPLGTLASGSNCRFCRENFSAGMEFYGGLGSTLNLSLADTAHYAAPVIAWLVSDSTTLRFSPGLGLTHESNPVLLRFGCNYEVKDLSTKISGMFRGRR